jgi:hypothetical protein
MTITFSNSIIAFFVLTTIFSLFLVYKVLISSEFSKKNALKVILLFILWLIIQAIVTQKGIYANSPNSFPPKITVLGIFPVIIIIIGLFVIPKTRRIISTFSLESLTYLNLVRIPVEIALYWLFLQKAVPEIMTFSGRNFDIVAGLTSPIIVYFYKKGLNKNIFLAWHFVCLMLLINIVFTAIFSAVSPFQKFGFKQPNIAIVNFPFSWLATFIVPMVLFGHLASIYKLVRK